MNDLDWQNNDDDILERNPKLCYNREGSWPVLYPVQLGSSKEPPGDKGMFAHPCGLFESLPAE